MSISSMTPEGIPNRCPLYLKDVVIESSALFGDATCPHCGHLLWFVNVSSGIRLYAHGQSGEVRERLINKIADRFGVDAEKVTGQLRFLQDAAAADSLDMVEVVMELEEEFDFLK